MNKDFTKITNYKVSTNGGIDYPDFIDAYISEAKWPDGSKLTEEELDELAGDYPHLYYDMIYNYLSN